MAADVDSDVPDWGAAFTFGRSRFSDNLAGKFWIKDDPILQIACGDEHTAILTASGRLFTFGSNEWGQLGHGHTKTISKPSFVKALKGERVTVIACGRSHTLVATAGGHVYGFGSNSEGQLGSADEQPVHLSPVRVQGLEGITIKMLSGGADHSMALTDKGVVYVWGSGAEGQIGPESGHILIPTELNLDCNILCISAGYYHSAFVTVDGKLYTCGEGESGKLGLPEYTLKKSPLSVHCVPAFDRKVTWVSCGGNHTIALTSDGKAYSFGNGYDGQLGLGSRLLDVSTPHQIVFLESVKVARVSCGENHSAFLTDKGHLYTCGNGRHGKLGLFGVDDSSNQFVPTLVTRFNNFQVQQVSCGGCHTLVLAVRQDKIFCPNASSQPVESSSARERRRQKNAKFPPLPPIISYNKNETMSPTLKAEYRQRLPSLSKGTVWYVSLDNTPADQNASDEEDEVLTGIEHDSLLTEVEKDESIRHVDSDVDSDSSESSELNKTHTLVRIDNTILIRPTVPDASTPLNKRTDLSESTSSKEELKSGVSSIDATETKLTKVGNLNLEDSKIVSPLSKEPSSEELQMKSHFYDNEIAENKNASISSKESKSSKACVIL
ncbi:x-linked retinitis pigmentosa GTPase regulator [Trichonephila inaurata madagascariensis]|uniref:X-linked retinitis pigmentosa GTPase regulator n=1 Tax=Trichonephila inaurata madagascariensis TaxID=2747483 RepID=A0A8X7C6E0_9ARAC|nr:x-linked retinitis pigmentosa GTPase regulator [Trichonephila inaurata madagascariensis]